MAIQEERKYKSWEFLAFIPESVSERYELINGKIFNMASPNEIHQRLVMRLSSNIDNYITQNKGKCRVYPAPFDVVLNDDNVVIPDVLVVCDPSKLEGKRCNGSPDFIIEVMSNNRNTDLIHKLELYQINGVREYWIVDPKNQKTLVYFFEKSDLPNIYTFDTPIPVNIYDRNLKIKIADLVL